VKATSFVLIVRYLLLDWVTYLVLPWAWAAFGFVVDVVIMQLTPAGDTSQRWVGGLAGVFIVVFVLETQAVARALPFGLALGVSRRLRHHPPPGRVTEPVSRFLEDGWSGPCEIGEHRWEG